MRQYEVNLGKACNNACVFCSNGQVPPAERRFLPFEQVASELECGRREGYEAVGFLGGEPTIRKDFPEIVRLARELGFRRVSLCTNGRRLRDARYLDELLDAGLTRVTLSIHSHLPRVENAICRRNAAFEQKLAAIRNLVERASRLVDGFALNSCIHGANVGRLAAQAAFFKDAGVVEIRFNWLRPEADAVARPRWVPRLAGLPEALGRLVSWNELEGRMRITVSDVPWCALPPEIWAAPGLARRYVGELRDWETTVVVHRTGDRDEFTWAERRAGRLKTRPPACAGCAAASCEGVWIRYVELYGTDGIQPLDEESASRFQEVFEEERNGDTG